MGAIKGWKQRTELFIRLRETEAAVDFYTSINPGLPLTVSGISGLWHSLFYTEVGQTIFPLIFHDGQTEAKTSFNLLRTVEAQNKIY